jgi:hypothetical protein
LGALVAALLLAYDFIFLETFLNYGNTTSFFPWAWQVGYSNFDAMEQSFLLAFVIALAVLVACMISFGIIYPKAVNASQS